MTKNKQYPKFDGICAALLLTAGLTWSVPATAQERWFKVEISIFSNELEADRLEELWSPDSAQIVYPKGMRRLSQMSDLLMAQRLMVVDETEQDAVNDAPEYAPPTTSFLPSPAELRKLLQRQRETAIAQVGPEPAVKSDFKFFDLDRDGFLLLPAAESDFLQTNRAIDRAPEHRLLFHGVWRQAMPDPAQAIPVYINGGMAFGDQHELEGSVTMRFNDNRDRVVIDANLWLSEFNYFDYTDQAWVLPKPPQVPSGSAEAAVQEPLADYEYFPIQVFHMLQSREMRSGEFHYLDHPAMGVVIGVEPYEVPELPLPEDLLPVLEEIQ